MTNKALNFNKELIGSMVKLPEIEDEAIMQHQREIAKQQIQDDYVSKMIANK